MTSPAHVIVLGNEKGGSGKSTTAMHIFVALAREGQVVGAMDLDTRQQTFFRYLENRAAFNRKREDQGLQPLVMPIQRQVDASDHVNRDVAEQEELERFSAAVADLYHSCDVLIIDCPGTDTYLSRLGHAAADTLITPMNDSFIDFDLLGRIEPGTQEIVGPSIYAEMVWECRKLRAESGLSPLDWIVMRNRLDPNDNASKRRVGDLLEALSKRIQFRVAPGFSERLIYRDLFLNGLTLLDVREPGADVDLTMSHVAARQEVDQLLKQLDLPGLGASALDDRALSS